MAPPPVPPVDSGISHEDFIRHWKHCQECTSSSYSGLHCGHYKASVDCLGIANFHILTMEMASTMVIPFPAGNPAYKFFWRKGMIPSM